jgi:hypothetical protein
MPNDSLGSVGEGDRPTSRSARMRVSAASDRHGALAAPRGQGAGQSRVSRAHLISYLAPADARLDVALLRNAVSCWLASVKTRRPYCPGCRTNLAAFCTEFLRDMAPDVVGGWRVSASHPIATRSRTLPKVRVAPILLQ